MDATKKQQLTRGFEARYEESENAKLACFQIEDQNQHRTYEVAMFAANGCLTFCVMETMGPKAYIVEERWYSLLELIQEDMFYVFWRAQFGRPDGDQSNRIIQISSRIQPRSPEMALVFLV